MNLVEDILRRLQQMPEEEKAKLHALREERAEIWTPNVGPQLEAYESPADELFYGGSAGGGKSDLLIGLTLTRHKRSLILRRTNKEASKLFDRYHEILGTRDGWNGQDKIWRLPDGRIIDIGGCQYEDDKQGFKGTARDLYCVAKGTPVRMATGAYLPVEDLRVGMKVATLEGPRAIERVYPKRQKPCVRLAAYNASGEPIVDQVHSLDHAIASPVSWISAAGLDGACAATQSHESGRLSLSLQAKYATLCNSPLEKIGRFLRRGECDQQPMGHPRGWGKFSFWERLFQGICSEASDDAFSGNLLLPLLCGLPTLPQPYQRLAGQAGHLHARARADLYGSERSLSRYFQDGYSFDLGQYDEHIPQHGGLSTVSMGGQQHLLLLNDAALPNPSYLQGGDMGNTRIYSRMGTGTYSHPYTMETRQVGESCSLHVAPFKYSYAGVREVYDIQVEEVRHFITAGGVINKNCFDELPDFSESQFRFIIGWNRSADPNQRCRVVAAGNPPTSPMGYWIVKYWGPWLDETHPKPARPGELRWFTTIGGEDHEVDGPGPHLIGGEMIRAKSRTFIPARLTDNPFLARTDYAARLAALPEPLRSAYKDGRFDISMKDADFQVIPTAWILAAQARWRPDGWKDFAMTAMAYDPAGGGNDSAELCWRHGGWYAEFVSAQGEDTADGSVSAGHIIRHRRDNAPVVVDAGGGYGGAVMQRLRDNAIAHTGFNGAGGSPGRSKDGMLHFANKRAEVYWRFREELDPDQPGGSAIALPPDPELRADLAAPTYTVGSRGILIESKDEIRKRLGRSTGKGDVAVYCLSEGNAAVRRQIAHQAGSLPAFAKGSLNSGPLSRYRKRG